ncbi:PAS domain-containing sensor histidine kinase [bacterium]|nr:PAS domain-containing sensor histidine kinase [bacterium]
MYGMTEGLSGADKKSKNEGLDQIFNISVPMCVIDKDFNILRVNDRFCSAFSMKREEIVGKKCYEVRQGPVCNTSECSIRQILNGPGHYEYEITDKKLLDGSKVSYLVSAHPYRGSDGEIIGVVENFTNITELKRAEKELERINAELARKNKELQDVLYVASHDLRSPLVNIQGFCKELDYSLKDLASAIDEKCSHSDVMEKIKPILSEDIPVSIGFILSSTAKMDSLISGLLQVSRLGHAVINPEKLDMQALISGVISGAEFRIKEKDIKLEISELPSCMADMNLINQVFSNLLDNALKYIDPNRQGIVRISGYKKDNMSVYCVEDNGIGIASEHQQKVFEMFYQFDPAANPGEGLGLTIVRRIIDRQKGEIWLESEPGKGSRFFVSLPGA